MMDIKSIMTLWRFIMRQISIGPTRNVHYTARLKFLSVYRNNKEYVDKLCKQLGVDKDTLHDDAVDFMIKSQDFIKERVRNYTKSEFYQIYENPENLISEVNEWIKEEYNADIFLR